MISEDALIKKIGIVVENWVRQSGWPYWTANLENKVDVNFCDRNGK